VDRASEERYAKDLFADPLIRAVDRTFPVWVLVGLAWNVVRITPSAQQAKLATSGRS